MQFEFNATPKVFASRRPRKLSGQSWNSEKNVPCETHQTVTPCLPTVLAALFTSSQRYLPPSSRSAKIFQRRGRKGSRRGTQSRDSFAAFAKSSASSALNRKSSEFGCISAALRLCVKKSTAWIRIRERAFLMHLPNPCLSVSLRG